MWSAVSVVVGVFLVWFGWKVTAVTIVHSWLNEFGLFIIYFGVLLTHAFTLKRFLGRIAEDRDEDFTCR